MRQIFLLISLSILLIGSSAFATEPKYLIHTSAKDVEFKKKKSLDWYKDNVEDKRFYGYDPNKHITLLKNKSLKWYENNIVKGKNYFINSKNESEALKKKSLRWYDRNSQ